MLLMPRTMRGVRQLRLAALFLVALGAVGIYEMVSTKEGLVILSLPYGLACQWLLDRFDRRFIDGFTRRR